MIYFTWHIQVSSNLLSFFLESMLIIAVLKWAKRGLNTTDSDFSIHELESVCMDSYNLTLHIFSTFPPERAREALENAKEVRSRQIAMLKTDATNIVL